jgi:hypothetical protein
MINVGKRLYGRTVVMYEALNENAVNVGIGFVTGRRSFRHVVRTYAENWEDSGLTGSTKLNISVYVAYDLKYKNTKPEDYRNLDKRVIDIVDCPLYLGEAAVNSEMAKLTSLGIISKNESELLFGEGYAKKRNTILYFALKNKIDYLLFLDDDEYPVAVSRDAGGLAWRGQRVLGTHLESIPSSDITYGYHCGYISPIPYVRYNKFLTENDFRIFIETISNDIISWDSIKQKMRDGGVTFADKRVIENRSVEIVGEVRGAKFISGSNLCINLKNTDNLYPFYNPPEARGEDTFLSTCLSNSNVLKVPCYSFHDGFSAYQQLLCGALPQTLKPIHAGEHGVNDRFRKACVGWIRYKPLFIYITNRRGYDDEIRRMKENLHCVLPKISRYFGSDEFMKLKDELDFYAGKVEEHFEMFEATKRAWRKVVRYLNDKNNRILTQVN